MVLFKTPFGEVRVHGWEKPLFQRIKWSASDVWCRFVPEPGESAVRRSQIWPWKLDRWGWAEGPYDRGFIHETDCGLSQTAPGTHGRWGSRGVKGILEGKRKGRKGFLMKVVGMKAVKCLNPFKLEVFCWKESTSWSSFCASVSHVKHKLYYSEAKLVIWLHQAVAAVGGDVLLIYAKQPNCGRVLYWPPRKGTKCLDQNHFLYVTTTSLLRNVQINHWLGQPQVLNHIWRHRKGLWTTRGLMPLGRHKGANSPVGRNLQQTTNSGRPIRFVRLEKKKRK